jgi:UDPglucose 6-dehydrogenase
VRLSVIGCGHLGTVHAACLAEIGHDVLGLDIDEDKVTLLNSGKAWFHEPGLDEMLGRHLASGRLRFTTSFAAAAEFASVHFLGVATPGLASGTYDVSQVTGAVRALARHLDTGALIVGKSTVPPGTAASLAAAVGDRADIAWNPEFLREGCGVRDTLAPDRIVIGVAGSAAETTLREIYRPLTDAGTPLVVTDLATAELVKVAANAFLAAKLTFINTMADLCALIGGDVTALAAALGLDPRIGPRFLGAGVGYGGGCIPKDVRGLAAFAEQAGAQAASDLLTLLDEINSERRERVVALVGQAVSAGSDQEQDGRPLAGRKVAVWGAAFKPGTDDVRDSPGLDIACRLHALGARVTVFDPMATASALAAAPQLHYAGSALEAAQGAEAIVAATPWPEFAEVSPVAAGENAAALTVVDSCQALDGAAWETAGWTVLSLAGHRTAELAGVAHG